MVEGPTGNASPTPATEGVPSMAIPEAGEPITPELLFERLQAVSAERDSWRERALGAETSLAESNEVTAVLQNELDEERHKRAATERDLAAAIISLVRMEAETESLQEQAENATRDPDTGLHNRLGLQLNYEALVKVWPNPEREHVILFIDLDRFKDYNTLLGHVTTDTFVVAVSDVLKNTLRKSDMLGRYGKGDEFVVILPNTGIENASQVAEKLRESIKVIKEVEGKPVEPTMSIGVARIRTDKQFLESCQPANRAMFEAKRAGGDTVSISED